MCRKVKIIKQGVFKWAAGFVLIAALIISAFAPAAAMAPRSGGKTVKVGWYITPDYMEISEDGTPGGYYYDYLQTLSYYTGWKCEYVVGSWSECLERLADGEIDLLCSAHKTNDREEIMDFSSVEILTESCKLYVSDNNRYDFEDFAAFDGIRIAVSQDSYERKALSEYAGENGFTYQEILCDGYQEAFDAVDSGRADGMVSATFDNHEGYYVVGQFAPLPVYFGVREGAGDILSELNYGMSCIATYYPTFDTVLYNKYVSSYAKQHITLTSQERQYIENIGAITMACGTAWYPYEYHNEAGEFTGFSVEIMKQIAEITGIQVEFVEDTGFSMSMFRETSKENWLTSMSWDSAWAADSNVAQTQSFLDADILQITAGLGTKCKTVALLNSGYIYRNVIANYPELEVVICSSTKDCVAAVADGRADCTFLNEYEASYYLELSRYHRLSSYRISKFTQGICFGVSASSDPMLVEILSKALTYIDADERDAIMNASMPVPRESSVTKMFYDYPVAFITMGVVLCVAAFALVFLLYRSGLEKKKRLEVEQANRARTDFLARMSHDMRTPMNGVLGLAALMLDQDVPDEVREDLIQIQMSGKYLLNLINDTLDMNRIEANRLELHPAATDAYKITENIIGNARMLADEKGVSLSLQKIHPEKITPATLFIDESRIEQIFMNLISNAVKFTPAGGAVLLTIERLETAEDYILSRYEVKDTGIGMSQEFLKHLYEPFSQEGRANNDRASGSGLGMAIVHQLVEMMGGDLRVESRINVGTTFTLTIRFERYLGAESAASAVNGDNIRFDGRRVLLCEDHPLNRKIACRLLEKKGALVDVAENGKEGVRKFEQSEKGYYDLILMDIRMPEMNGLEAAEKIRALRREDAKTVPIVAMSANAFDTDRQKSLEAGMNAHLGKPVEPELLYETLRELL